MPRNPSSIGCATAALRPFLRAAAALAAREFDADCGRALQPLGSGKQGGKETGYAQIEVKASPVQAHAAPKNFNRTEALGLTPLRHEISFTRQRNRRPRS